MKIEDKIKEGEGLHLDFKMLIDNQRKIAKTMCAFANTDGGTILIGVKENGKVSGCEPSEQFHMISAAADLYTEPIIPFTSQIHQVKHKLVLQIDVQKSNELHQSLDEENLWHYYLRVKDVSLEANPVLERYLEMKMEKDVKPQVVEGDFGVVLSLFEGEVKYSFSRLHKMTDLKLNRLEEVLAQLIYWDLIGYTIDETGVVYLLKNP